MTYNKLDEPLSQYVGKEIDVIPLELGQLPNSYGWVSGLIHSIDDVTNWIVVETANGEQFRVPPNADRFVFFS